MRALASGEWRLVTTLLEMPNAEPWVVHSRIDFVCRVPSYHVLDSLVSTWVVLKPGIDFEYSALDNDDMASFGDQCFNLITTKDSIFAGSPRWGSL